MRGNRGQAGYVRGVKIEAQRNFTDCSYTGISLGWGWTKMTNALRDNLIDANYIHHVATRLNGHSRIYIVSQRNPAPSSAGMLSTTLK